MITRSQYATVLRDEENFEYLLFTTRSDLTPREQVWLKSFSRPDPVRLYGDEVEEFMLDHKLQAVNLAARGPGPFYTIYHGGEVET